MRPLMQLVCRVHLAFFGWSRLKNRGGSGGGGGEVREVGSH